MKIAIHRETVKEGLPKDKFEVFQWLYGDKTTYELTLTDMRFFGLFD